MENYKTLEKVFKKISDIDNAKAMLHWDAAVMMPPAGAEARADQLATLERISHAIITDESLVELVNNAGKKGKPLNAWQKANLHNIKKKIKHVGAVEDKLAEALVKEGAKCEMVWRQARKDNDFKSYAASLKEVVNIVRKVAQAKAEVFECSSYDALLDQYDPGRTSKQVDEIFDDLKEFLPGFIGEVIEKQKSRKIIDFEGKFPIERQKSLGHKMLKIIGFDLNKGRLDTSHHPFCGGYPSDIRITTRYNEDEFISSMMGVQHEAGHAMYEAALPAKWKDQLVGKACGMSIHESQSLLIEMQICRSREFLEFAAPIIKKELKGEGDAWECENIYNISTKVEPSFIRVDADEVTYPAHVLLRYYIEKYLIAGDMEVEDLPDAWAQGMERFLGIKPDSDTQGCMQDIHWTDGSFGYFPTYALGAMYAAQIFAAAKNADSKIAPAIAKGNFKPIVRWLGKNIHQQASKYSPDKLVEEATGSALNPQIYKDYLKDKYLS